MGSNKSTKSISKKIKTTADLRKKLDVTLTDAAVVQAFRDRIIGAAVSASRKSKHLSNFKGPDGELYPDVAKAFAAYSGLKPCERCKSNKQGVSFEECFGVDFCLYIVATTIFSFGALHKFAIASMTSLTLLGYFFN